MQARDLHWLQETLPWIMGGCREAETAVSRAILESANDPSDRTRGFWLALGQEIADNLQARWAFEYITLEEATMLSHELAVHLVDDE